MNRIALYTNRLTELYCKKKNRSPSITRDFDFFDSVHRIQLFNFSEF